MLHQKSRWQVWSLSACVMLYGSCSSYYQRYIQEQEDRYYTENTYETVGYNQEEFQDLWYLKDQYELEFFIKQLNDRFDQWNQAAPEPIRLWEAYRTECLKSLEEKVPILERYHDTFAQLLKNPNDIQLQKAIKDAHKALQSDRQVQARLRQEIMDKYNNLGNLTISKATLEYKEFIDFILNDTKAILFHVKIKKLKNRLTQWEAADHKSGIELWKTIVKKQNSMLKKKSKLFKYQENQKAVNDFLEVIETNKNNLYNLSCKDLQETIPHGHKILYGILHELDQDTEEITLLKTYCRFIEVV